MACPTCDHTTQSIGDGWRWCPRCGTLVRHSSDPWEPPPEPPMLVGRVRRMLDDPRNQKSARVTLFESVHLPKDRA